ncbi:MAG: tRNA preQ1(34) S-adenosylmethionine ribosyltransferase-isomerase QueA [Candidatus Omnitrophica bacterium]|jgi:S-adenosylmethionine:tRNA ribosyltransferase-isomerase|nr:tRNA preQ1(34) S-adenosylmethionine ribosyltransferase-isomerase QueA [Candidatus Omnitrophota bacterium]MDD5253210.1 tRNA preQ1(34) S-adenosylmethionine ribosyltransferase-isomerase QueA [Candidatus Omnitrophota bacterium]
MLTLSEFDYPLPKELIAQYPLEKREDARLMVVDRKTGKITHAVFNDVGSFFKQKDLLVLNDTKVLHCRLMGKKTTGGRVEILLTRRLNGSTFSCLVQPSRTKIGEKILFAEGKISGALSARGQISFKQPDADVIYNYGVVPLPPYIKREPVDSDKVYYQTVYAKNEGALASPTAGLHFTEKMLADLPLQGIQLAYVTLHVGLGTFRPVRCENILEHKMEPEYFQVPDEAIAKLKQAKEDHGKIIAVGTTALRTLETYADGRKEGNTDLFIYPGYKFKLVDCLLTNFHLPMTTLFMLVCAFGGEKLMKQAYQEAVEKQYRFYSYGDAMLII